MAAAPGCCEAERLGVAGWSGCVFGYEMLVGAAEFHMERRKEMKNRKWSGRGGLAAQNRETE
jgi:hypothetical protein